MDTKCNKERFLQKGQIHRFYILQKQILTSTQSNHMLYKSCKTNDLINQAQEQISSNKAKKITKIFQLATNP